jgi:enoyl-CoA hydratase/carnithine racemase
MTADHAARVRIDRDGPIALVTLVRADKHNGVDFPMIHALVDAAAQLGRDRSVRGAIIAGEGPSFCAGLDFKAVFGKPTTTAIGVAKLWSPIRNKFQDVSMVWRELAIPVVAAIHGACFGAGMQLALGCDLRFATADAKLSLMEAKYGLIPDMGGVALMRELVRIDVAKELVMTGRTISGVAAAELGLVTRIGGDPVAMAREVLAEIATRSPDSVAAGKLMLQEAWHLGETEALSAERRYQRSLIGRPNQRAAMAGKQQFGARKFG